jgi:hypothetical protein
MTPAVPTAREGRFWVSKGLHVLSHEQPDERFCPSSRIATKAGVCALRHPNCGHRRCARRTTRATVAGCPSRARRNGASSPSFWSPVRSRTRRLKNGIGRPGGKSCPSACERTRRLGGLQRRRGGLQRRKPRRPRVADGRDDDWRARRRDVVTRGGNAPDPLSLHRTGGTVTRRSTASRPDCQSVRRAG